MIIRFKQIYNNLIFKIILAIITSLSIALLSTYLMIGNIEQIYVIITFIVSFLFGIIYIIKKYRNIVETLENNEKYFYASLVLGLIIFYCFKTNYVGQIQFINSFLISFNHMHYFALPGIVFILFTIVINIKEWLNSFIKEMDLFEKKAYIITTVIFLILIIFLYLKNSYFYLQYDKVYSMDSGWVYSSIMSNLYYYDIRHPIMSILTYPIYAITSFLFSSTIRPIIFQFINIQLLILIGLELKRMTNNKFTYIMYIVSFSTLLYSLFFEKYVLCTFLMVTYLYNIFVKNNSSNKILTLTVGVLPTNIFICIAEIFRNIKIKEKIKNIFKIGLVALLFLIMTGRIHCLINGYDELFNMKDAFGGATYTLNEKVNSISNMIQGSLLYIPSNGNNSVYLWNNILGQLSVIGIIILIVILFGILKNVKNKNRTYFVFLISLLFSFVLFGYLNWSVHESPLFSIIFSWAVIPLFIYGIDVILYIFKIKDKYKKYICTALCLIILLVNFYGIIDIYKFIISI